jgi:predicted XRE-type DNA-binding protein
MNSIKFSNAFDAVTDNKEEACELQIRADLMIALRDIVEEKGWKQAEAAVALKLTQPRVSDLLQGKIDKFSIDLLMTCLHRVGFRYKPTYETAGLV